MKMYLSKYALTNGIIEVDVEYKYGDVFLKPKGYMNHFKYGKEIHDTYQEAAYIAEELRIRKIDALKKQIGKLEKLRFDQDGEE